MSTEEELVKDCVARTVTEFETNPAAGRTLRRFADEMPGVFTEAAIALLLKEKDSPGCRYLCTLLLKNPDLFNQLSNPRQYTRQQAVILGRHLLKADPSLDLRLAKQLPGRESVDQWDTLQGSAAERALDILDEISPGRRLVPVVSHLTRHPDRLISSKAALFVGKRLQNLAWATRMIAESPDARVRANAIESVWGVDTPEIVELFWRCVNDRNNRLVGNAIVGLRLAGVTAVDDVIKRYARDYKPEFRMTSAWAMGKIGDAVFIPELSPLVKDENPGVRSAALRALQNIRKHEKRIEKAPEPAAMPEPANEEPAAEPLAKVPVPFAPQLDGGVHYVPR